MLGLKVWAATLWLAVSITLTVCSRKFLTALKYLCLCQTRDVLKELLVPLTMSNPAQVCYAGDVPERHGVRINPRWITANTFWLILCQNSSAVITEVPPLRVSAGTSTQESQNNPRPKKEHQKLNATSQQVRICWSWRHTRLEVSKIITLIKTLLWYSSSTTTRQWVLAAEGTLWQLLGKLSKLMQNSTSQLPMWMLKGLFPAICTGTSVPQRFLKFLLLVLCSLHLVSLCISVLLYFSDLNVHTHSPAGGAPMTFIFHFI